METALIALTYTGVVVLIALTVFIVKLLIDTSTLVRSLNETTQMLKTETKPLLETFQQIAALATKIMSNTEKKYDTMKNSILGVMSTLSSMACKTKGLYGGIIGGLLAGLRIFSKK